MKKNESIFIISDIHGCALELRMLIDKLPLTPESTIIFLGDYIDRGEHSKDVIDIILGLKTRFNVITLKGNHEQMLLDFLEDSNTLRSGNFFYNGGGATLASYSDNSSNYNIPEEHIDFFKSLKLFYELDDYIFVHAGLPDVKISDIDIKKHEHDILWIRDPFLTSMFNWKKLIIHGHTPEMEAEILQNRINIDTACVYNNKLTALQLPQKKLYSVKKQSPIEHVFLKDETGPNRKAVRFLGSFSVNIYLKGKTFIFEAVNYNDFSLLVRSINIEQNQLMQIGEKISGELNIDSQDTIRFEGIIIRHYEEFEKVYYAIKFIKTPFELYSKNLI